MVYCMASTRGAASPIFLTCARQRRTPSNRQTCPSTPTRTGRARSLASRFLAAARPSPSSSQWEQKVPPRDLKTGRLRADPVRFPSGMKALGDYYHVRPPFNMAIVNFHGLKVPADHLASVGIP